jgi:hypothetical protein
MGEVGKRSFVSSSGLFRGILCASVGNRIVKIWVSRMLAGIERQS